MRWECTYMSSYSLNLPGDLAFIPEWGFMGFSLRRAVRVELRPSGEVVLFWVKVQSVARSFHPIIFHPPMVVNSCLPVSLFSRASFLPFLLP